MNAFSYPPFGHVYFINYNYFFSSDEYSYKSLIVLPVHEFRHTSQYSILQIFKYPYQILSFANYSYYMLCEGDASLTETLLTPFGRGREPYFFMKYKASMLDYDLSYAQYLYGSHNYETGNIYTLGYLLNCYIRKHYGLKQWKRLLTRNKILDNVKSIFDTRQLILNLWEKIYPLTLHRKIESITGKNIINVFEDMKQEMRSKWKNQINDLRLSKFTIVSPKSSSVVSYKYPQQQTQSEIFALRDNKIVELIKNKTIINLRYEAYFSYSNDYFCWVIDSPISKYPKFRGINRNSILNDENRILCVYNRKTNNLKRITEAKYYHEYPVLSNDGRKIAVLISDYRTQKVVLSIINSETGKTIKKIYNEKHIYHGKPCWSKDNQYIYIVTLHDFQSAITRINIETQEHHVVVNYSDVEKYHPFVYNDCIYFNSPYNGIDNIYCFKTDQIYQVTFSKYGAYNPYVYDKQLLYNDYSSKGMLSVKSEIDESQWIKLNDIVDRNIYYFKDIENQERFKIKIDDLKRISKLDITPYIVKTRKLMNVKISQRLNVNFKTLFNPAINDTWYNTLRIKTYLLSFNLSQTLKIQSLNKFSFNSKLHKHHNFDDYKKNTMLISKTSFYINNHIHRNKLSSGFIYTNTDKAFLLTFGYKLSYLVNYYLTFKINIIDYLPIYHKKINHDENKVPNVLKINPIILIKSKKSNDYHVIYTNFDVASRFCHFKTDYKYFCFIGDDKNILFNVFIQSNNVKYNFKNTCYDFILNNKNDERLIEKLELRTTMHNRKRKICFLSKINIIDFYPDYSLSKYIDELYFIYIKRISFAPIILLSSQKIFSLGLNISCQIGIFELDLYSMLHICDRKMFTNNNFKPNISVLNFCFDLRYKQNTK